MNDVQIDLPPSVFIDHITESKLTNLINTLFYTTSFRYALTNDIYAVINTYWKKYLQEEHDVPCYIEIFDADKVIKDSVDKIFEDLYPKEDIEVFRSFYSDWANEVEKGNLDISNIDFSTFVLIMILNSGFLKKNLKRSYKTTSEGLKKELINLVSSKFIDICWKMTQKNHPNFPGVRPLNIFESRSILYDKEFINSFKRKNNKKGDK